MGHMGYGKAGVRNKNLKGTSIQTQQRVHCAQKKKKKNSLTNPVQAYVFASFTSRLKKHWLEPY